MIFLCIFVSFGIFCTLQRGRGAVWHVYCSHTPATDGIECRRSYGRWYR